MRDARPPLGATFFSGSWGASTSPASMALPCRRRSRPQHQKLTHAPQQIALFDGLVSEREPFVCNLQVERVSDQISGDEAKMNFRISRALPPPRGGLRSRRWTLPGRTTYLPISGSEEGSWRQVGWPVFGLPPSEKIYRQPRSGYFRCPFRYGRDERLWAVTLSAISGNQSWL